MRVYLLSAALAAAGIAVSFGIWGGAGALGFGIGATFSVLNYRWLHGMVESLGTDRPRRASAAFMSMRLLLLGGLLYVIVKYLETGLMAALCGLFTAIVAVILDSVYQHIYGTTP